MGPKTQDQAPVYPAATPYTDAVLERYKHNLNTELEMLKSVIQMGQSALKTIFLMNAGAAGAMLTFIGHLAINAVSKIPAFAYSLTAFVTGLLLSGLASGLSYGCQWLYHHKPKSSWGGWMNIAAVVVGALSLVAFTAGIYCTYQVFSTFNFPAAV